MNAHPLWLFIESAHKGATFVDLTHAFHPGQPKFPLLPDEERSLVFSHETASFQIDRYHLVGQWGTHVDPPLHFVKGGRPLDQIPVNEMLLPLCVLDISGQVASNPDAVPSLDDLAAWEARNGKVPAGSFVALRTGWSARWPDAVRFANKDAGGVSHAPGWSMPVLQALFEDRGVAAIGHEQIDTDPGLATSAGSYAMENYVLRRDRWQIELLTNLETLPEAGALIAAMWPKARGGSGFPARAMAIHL